MNPEDPQNGEMFKCNENVVKVPWQIETVNVFATKHFSKKYMSAWGWDYHAVREALRAAYAVRKTGTDKYEVYVNKGGYKKIVCVYYDDEDRIICITGSQGDTRV